MIWQPQDDRCLHCIGILLADVRNLLVVLVGLDSVVADVRYPLVVLVGLDCKSRPTAPTAYDRYDRYDIGDRLDRLFATFILRGGRGIEK